MKSPLRARFGLQKNFSFISPAPLHDTSSDLNKSALVGDLPQSSRSRLKKSKSTLLLRMKEQILACCGEQTVPNKISSVSHILSFHDSKLVFNQMLGEKSLDNSLEQTPDLFGEQAADKKETEVENVLKPLAEDLEENCSTVAPLSTRGDPNMAKGLDSIVIEERTPKRGHYRQDSESIHKENSPIYGCSTIDDGLKSPSDFIGSSLKIPLLKTYEDIDDKSPGKTSEKHQSPGSKIVPVFVFNIANNVNSDKKSAAPSLKDRIKERILDLVDTNAFKTTYTPSREARKEIEENTNSIGFATPSPLIKVTPMKNSLQKGPIYLTPKKTNNEAKSTADIVSTEPNECQPNVNNNAPISPFGAEKGSKRAPSLKRGETWSASGKPKSLTGIPTLTPQKTMDYKTEENSNVQRSKAGEFAFQMTYFKPIDESKLDEFINSTNVSRVHKTSILTTTPRGSSSPAKKRTPSEARPKIDRSQDVMNNTRDNSAIRPVKVEGRSISNQKARASTPVKTNSRLSSGLKVTNTGYKVDMDTSQKCMTSRMEEKKKPGKSVESFRAGNNGGDNTQRSFAKNKNIFGLDKGESAYSKLDKLLLELKNNNTSSKAIREDESNSVTDTASEAGLFNAVVEKNKESATISYAAKNSFRSTLIGMREN